MSHSAARAWERRWTRMLSVSCAVSFAASLVDPVEHGVLGSMRWETAFSR